MANIPFMGPNEDKKEEIAMTREQDFIRQRDLFNSAMTDDTPYLENRKDKEDLTRWQQDLDDEIQDTVHDLKREVFNSENGEWVPQQVPYGRDEEGKLLYMELPSMMNEIGIRAFKGAARPLMSRNLMMSNYSEENILTKLRGSINTFILNLIQNYTFYEVRKQDLSNIIRMFRNLIEPTHWRCLNNGERSYLNTINKRVEARTEMVKPEKKSSIMGVMS